MKKVNSEVNEWEKSDMGVFWGEIAPCDHLVHFYEEDHRFLETLDKFVCDGLNKQESVIVIATKEHLKYLDTSLRTQGYDLEQLILNDQYIALDALECLSKFMIDNWPDEKLFTEMVTELITKAQKNNRKVRAFGEMVAILWEQGHSGATVNLENLWHKIQQKDLFCLYCAYPKSGFTNNAQDSMDTICQSHSKVIDGEYATEIYYRSAV